MVVAMMAAVGCVENGLVGMERNSKRECYDLSNYCKKSSIQSISFLAGSGCEAHGLEILENSHSFGTSVCPSLQSKSSVGVGGGGIGQSEEEGTSAIVFAKPSIPSLRTRQQRTSGPNVMKNKADPDGSSSKSETDSRRESPGVRTRRSAGEVKPPSATHLHNHHLSHPHQQQQQQKQNGCHHPLSPAGVISLANGEKGRPKGTSHLVKVKDAVKADIISRINNNLHVHNNNNNNNNNNNACNGHNNINNNNSLGRKIIRQICTKSSPAKKFNNPTTSTSSPIHHRSDNNKTRQASTTPNNNNNNNNNYNPKPKRSDRISAAVSIESFHDSDTKMGVLCADRNCDKDPCGCPDISTGSPRPASLPSSAPAPSSPNHHHHTPSTRKRSLDLTAHTSTSDEVEPSFKSARRRVHRTPSVGSILNGGGSGNNHHGQHQNTHQSNHRSSHNTVTTRAASGQHSKLATSNEKDECPVDDAHASSSKSAAILSGKNGVTIPSSNSKISSISTRAVRGLNGFKLNNGHQKLLGEKLRLFSTADQNRISNQNLHNHQKLSGNGLTVSASLLSTCLTRVKNSTSPSSSVSSLSSSPILLTPSPSSGSPSSSSSSSSSLSSFLFQSNDGNNISKISVSDNKSNTDCRGDHCNGNSGATTTTTITTTTSCTTNSGSSITINSKGSTNVADSKAIVTNITTILSNGDSIGTNINPVLNDTSVSSPSSSSMSSPLPPSSHLCSKLTTRQSWNAQGRSSPTPSISQQGSNSSSSNVKQCNNINNSSSNTNTGSNTSFSSFNGDNGITNNTKAAASVSVTRLSSSGASTRCSSESNVPNLRQRSYSGSGNNTKASASSSMSAHADPGNSMNPATSSSKLSSSLSTPSLSLLQKQNGMTKIKSSFSSSSSSSSSSSVVDTAAIAAPKQVECKWRGCPSPPLDPCDLLDHVRKHAETQISKKKFACLWTDCKVYNQPSLSGSWLERHVVSHSGHRPFKCILPKCGQRFHSQAALERHVNSHFASTAAHGATKPGRSREEITQHKRRKQMKRRFAQSVKTSDFFDEDTMSAVKQHVHNLTTLTHIGLSDENPMAVSFTGTVVGKRTHQKSGNKQALVTFEPSHVLEDDWLPQAAVSDNEVNEMSVPLSLLPHDSVTNLYSSLYRRHRFRKHRRK